MTRADVMKEVQPLTAEEHEVWVEFVATHRTELRCDMARALFDDVRPAWDEYVPTSSTAPLWTAVWRTDLDAG